MKPTVGVLARYLLFQVPGWVLLGLILAVARDSFDLPAGLVGWAVALLVVVDLALFPLVRRAYETGESTLVGTGRLVGREGRVEQPIAPSGYVRVGNELWQAEAVAGRSFAAGTLVRVREVRDLTLLVESAE